MKAQTAVVLGATGLIGGYVLEQLLNDASFTTVRALVRHPIPLIHQKLEMHKVDFNNLKDFTAKMGSGDCIFCCVGTTRQKVKDDKEAYRRVDYNIPLSAARIGLILNFKTFLLVSSVGANAGSSNFYLKLKGETERDISLLSFESIHIFRPSILLGKRKEFRLGEKIGQVLMKAFSFLFIRSLTKYKPIHAERVAKAMVEAAKKEEAKGIYTYHYDEMNGLVSSA